MTFATTFLTLTAALGFAALLLLMVAGVAMTFLGIDDVETGS